MTTSARDTLAIVGASTAGIAAADAARAAGFDGRLVVFDTARDQPYDRPPLSKRMLLDPPDGAADGAAPVPLRPATHWAEHDITVRLGSRVTGLRAATRTLVLDGGETLDCAAIVLAPGAGHAPLPFPVDGTVVHRLRTAAEAAAVRDVLTRARRIAVIGAGFIGLEVAAAARSRGVDVVVAEATATPLAPVLGVQAAEFLLSEHRRAGVEFRLGQPVVAVARAVDGRAAVTLSDGEVLTADAVLAGTGVRPAIDWLADSGIDLADGIVTDDGLATAVPGVFAAGDAASWHNPIFACRMRVEHWTTAREQGAHAGRRAARYIRGESGAEPFAHVPYFWSDQLGHKIQYVGHALPGDRQVVVRRDARSLVVHHLVGERLTACTALNAPKDVMAARRAIATAAAPTPVAPADRLVAAGQ